MAVSLSLLAGGCGCSSPLTTPPPLASELSYFPTRSPFVATVATYPRGAAVQNVEALLGAFPLAKLAISALESTLSSAGVNYQRDVEPLYGNPIVLSALRLSSASSLRGSTFLAVRITKSAAKLAALVKGIHGLTAGGTVDGATLYRAGPAALAVDGATAVLGSSPAEVSAALNRHAHGGGLTAADYAKAMGSLPRNTLAQAFGSVAGAVSSSQAHRIPWVAAIRGYAVSLSATSTGITAQLRLDTSGAPLTTSELPITPGSAAPLLAGTLPIAVGVRDPARTIAFIEAALRSVDPAAYARFIRREIASRRKTGYDLNAFVGMLTGNLIVESDTRTTMVRADVSNRASAARQLARFPELARYIFPTAKSVTRQPGGFYGVKEARGKSFELGLVGSEFVAGMATPAQLRAFATAPATPVPNAQGSVAFRISLLELLQLGLGKPPNPLLAPILTGLSDITGSVSATPSALSGQLGLGVK
ncbi:MAG: hypothetical protein M3071_00885 [Actinomycetota bacterium]|nr:hypothetical protein [Actinomycetota bacterium]